MRRRKSKTWRGEEWKLQDITWLGRKIGKRKQSSLTILLSPPRIKWENWWKVSFGYDSWLNSEGPDAKTAVIRLRQYTKWWPSGAKVTPTTMKTNERLENAGVLSLVGREKQTGKLKNNKQQRMTQWPEGKTSACWSSHISRNWYCRQPDECCWLWGKKEKENFSFMEPWTAFYGRGNCQQFSVGCSPTRLQTGKEMGSRNSRDIFLSVTYPACTSRTQNKTEDGAVLPKKMNERIDTIGW